MSLNSFFISKFPLAYSSKDFLVKIFGYRTIEEIIKDIENDTINDKILNHCLNNGIQGFGKIEYDVFELAEYRVRYSFEGNIEKKKEIYEKFIKHIVSSSDKYSPAEIYFSFILAKYIVSHFTKGYWYLFAETESNIAKYCLMNYLMEIKQNKTEGLLTVHLKDNIKKMLEDLGITIGFIEEISLDFPVPDYINIIIAYDQYLKSLHELLYNEDWKLYRNYLYKGYVMLSFSKFSRLFKEHYKYRIINSMTYLGEPYVDIIKEIYEDLVKDYGSRIKPKTDLETNLTFDERALPPCIKTIYEKLISGVNLSHAERFHVTAFLLNVGLSVDEVVNLFSNSPDFNEKITRYQVEHIAGKKGSGTKYKPGNCKTFKMNNLCVANDDKLCKKVNHPLTYYKIKLKALKNEDDKASLHRDEV